MVEVIKRARFRIILMDLKNNNKTKTISLADGKEETLESLKKQIEKALTK